MARQSTIAMKPGPEPLDDAAQVAIENEIANGPFKRRTPAAAAPKRGRPSRGALSTVSARLPVERVDRLDRLRQAKGWTLVVTLERAIDLLASTEGVD